eukprot:COSAG06_NODE_3604_length_5131_cov_1.935612_6_plen_152_part_00
MPHTRYSVAVALWLLDLLATAVASAARSLAPAPRCLLLKQTFGPPPPPAAAAGRCDPSSTTAARTAATAVSSGGVSLLGRQGGHLWCLARSEAGWPSVQDDSERRWEERDPARDRSMLRVGACDSDDRGRADPRHCDERGGCGRGKPCGNN